jgi:hypothetical protein
MPTAAMAARYKFKFAVELPRGTGKLGSVVITRTPELDVSGG